MGRVDAGSRRALAKAPHDGKGYAEPRAESIRLLPLARRRRICYSAASTMNTADDNAIAGLERAVGLLEQALRARLGALQETRAGLASAQAENRRLSAEVARLRALVADCRRRAGEDGGRIAHAAREIRAALGET